MRIQFKLDKSAPQGRKLKYSDSLQRNPCSHWTKISQYGGGSLLVPAWERQSGRWPAHNIGPSKKQRTINSAFAACNGYQRSPSVPFTLVSIPDITHKKSKFYESLGFSDTLKFVYAALFPEDFSRFWSTLVNLRDIHKSLICTEQGGSICLGFGPLIFWKTQELENFRVQIEEQLSPFALLGIWLQIYYFWECLHCK